jgi:hypothetical protein
MQCKINERTKSEFDWQKNQESLQSKEITHEDGDKSSHSLIVIIIIIAPSHLVHALLDFTWASLKKYICVMGGWRMAHGTVHLGEVFSSEFLNREFTYLDFRAAEQTAPVPSWPTSPGLCWCILVLCVCVCLYLHFGVKVRNSVLGSRWCGWVKEWVSWASAVHEEPRNDPNLLACFSSKLLHSCVPITEVLSLFVIPPRETEQETKTWGPTLIKPHFLSPVMGIRRRKFTLRRRLISVHFVSSIITSKQLHIQGERKLSNFIFMAQLCVIVWLRCRCANITGIIILRKITLHAKEKRKSKCWSKSSPLLFTFKQVLPWRDEFNMY